MRLLTLLVVVATAAALPSVANSATLLPTGRNSSTLLPTGRNSSTLLPAGRKLVAGTCKAADALGSCSACDATTNACAMGEAPTGWFNCFTLAMVSCTDDRTTGPWFECRTGCKWWDWGCAACRWSCSGYDKVSYAGYCNHRSYFPPYEVLEPDRCCKTGCDELCQ